MRDIEKFFSGDMNRLPQSGDYLERPRLNNLLEKAMNYPLVVVCAGAGYGKTRMVYSFLQQYNANTTWIQISERDNLGRRFWENYVSMISLSWPGIKPRLLSLGLPETEETLTKYQAIVRELAALPGKHVRVFDDVHILHNPGVLRFCERGIRMIPPNVTTILISRTIPEINLIGMMMYDNVFMIQEDMLCFNEDEIAQYFNQLNITASKADIQNLHNDTQGWAFAVNLIGRSQIKEQKFERYVFEAMKKNIFRLIESEITQTVSEPLWRFLLRISLIDNLAANLVRVLAKDDALIKEMESLNAYIRYDFHMDAYLIHHLFLDYLRQKQDQLSDTEKKETYLTAGKWCDENDYHMDALSYYEASGDYNSILRKVALFNAQVPMDVAGYALEIFERLPDELKNRNPMFPGLHIRLKINLGQRNKETMDLLLKYAKEYESHPDSPERSHALNIIYASGIFLRLHMCGIDHIYDFDFYAKKMYEYYNKHPYHFLSQFNFKSESAWASLVGTTNPGAQEECIGAISRMVPYLSNLVEGLMCGYEELIWGELYFMRGEYYDAERYLKQAYDKGRVYNSFATLDRALVYLIQLSIMRGDFTAATKTLQTMEALLSDNDMSDHLTMYDVVYSFYHMALDHLDLVPEWLKGDFSMNTRSTYVEDYANRVRIQYHYRTRQYGALLAYIENALQHEKVLFGRIYLKIVQALVLYNLKQRDEAIAMLVEAYNLSESNRVILIFILYAKEMRTLTAAAMRDGNCPIPMEWLEAINRKSSAYAKRKARMISDYNVANNIEVTISLSNREIEILKDLAQGLSRTEIAASQNISVNTVKMVVNMIYEKLNANSLADAIRIAADRKLI